MSFPCWTSTALVIPVAGWTSCPGTNKALVGYALSIFAGIMYGTNFLPCNSAMKRYPTATKTDMEFSQFCGIFVASFVYFFIYCIYKKNKPVIHIRSVMPGFVSGMMWGVAQIAGLRE